MAKTSYITVQTRFAGIHNWGNCPLKEVGFLANDHRHMFYVYVDMQVTHNDRDLEFFIIQNELNNIIKDWHETDLTNGITILGSRSCETIADLFIEALRILHPTVRWIRVSVSEDKENSGSVVWEAD